MEFTYDMLLDNIREVITEKGIKQKAIAERCGWTDQKFSNMMNRRQTINVEDVAKIAAVLDTDVNRMYQIRQ